MIEILLEVENVDVLADEMKPYLESIINLINNIKDELYCENEDHRKMAIYSTAQLAKFMYDFTKNIKKVRLEILGVPEESISFH